MSLTFLFSVFFPRHDTVATFLHLFMHRLPRLLMNPVSCLSYHPSSLVTCCILLPASPLLSESLQTRFPPSLDTLSVPLYPFFIRRFLVRSRSVHVYICIDPHTSKLTLPFRVSIQCSPPLLNIFSSAIRMSPVSPAVGFLRAVTSSSCQILSPPLNFHAHVISLSSI